MTTLTTIPTDFERHYPGHVNPGKGTLVRADKVAAARQNVANGVYDSDSAIDATVASPRLAADLAHVTAKSEASHAEVMADAPKLAPEPDLTDEQALDTLMSLPGIRAAAITVESSRCRRGGEMEPMNRVYSAFLHPSEMDTTCILATGNTRLKAVGNVIAKWKSTLPSPDAAIDAAQSAETLPERIAETAKLLHPAGDFPDPTIAPADLAVDWPEVRGVDVDADRSGEVEAESDAEPFDGLS